MVLRSYVTQTVSSPLKIILLDEIIFSARKRSVGQGNIFTSVCQEFCSQGGLVPGGHLVLGEGGCLVLEGCLVWGVAWSGGCLVLGGCLVWGSVENPPRTATAAGGMHPTGMHSCLSLNSVKTFWGKLKCKSVVSNKYMKERTVNG